MALFGVQDVENQASITVNAAIDALGDRLASGTSSAYAFLIPDLHANVADQRNSSGSTVTDAFRYDAYGLTEGTVLTGSVPSPWRFQGKLLESTSGGRDLYDFEARSYSPDIGAFTQLDSVAGSAINPVTLDRYLYAAGNPETLIDPDGHASLGSATGNCGPDNYLCAPPDAAAKKQVASYRERVAAEQRVNKARLWKLYGESGDDTDHRVTAPDVLAHAGRDQAEEQLTTAQVQQADTAAGAGMLQAYSPGSLAAGRGGEEWLKQMSGVAQKAGISNTNQGLLNNGEPGSGAQFQEGQWELSISDLLDTATKGLAVLGIAATVDTTFQQEVQSGQEHGRSGPEEWLRATIHSAARIGGGYLGALAGGAAGGIAGEAIFPGGGGIPVGILGAFGGAYAGSTVADQIYNFFFGQ